MSFLKNTVSEFWTQTRRSHLAAPPFVPTHCLPLNRSLKVGKASAVIDMNSTPIQSSRRQTVLLFSFHQDQQEYGGYFEELARLLNEHDLDLLVTGVAPKFEYGSFSYIPIPRPYYVEPYQERGDGTESPNALVKRIQDRQKVWGFPIANSVAILESYHATQRFLSILKPRLTIIWNGQWPEHLMMKEALGSSKVVYLERAPFRDTLCFDEQGVLAGSTQASRQPNEETPRFPSETLRFNSWHKQPARRQPLPIAEGKLKIVFFCQIDEDTQSFLFSPYSSNVEAFKAFLLALKPYAKDLFIYAKPHPVSKTDPLEYQAEIETFGFSGLCSHQADISEALQWADHTATVNSGSLFESLCVGHVPLALGQHALSHNDIAYRLDEVGGWLAQSGRQDRIERFERFLTLYIESFSGVTEESSMHFGGVGKLADFILRMSSKATATNSGDRSLACDYLNLWHERNYYRRHADIAERSIGYRLQGKLRPHARDRNMPPPAQ